MGLYVAAGVHQLGQLERVFPEASPLQLRLAPLQRMLSWCSFHRKGTRLQLLPDLSQATQISMQAVDETLSKAGFRLGMKDSRATWLLSHVQALCQENENEKFTEAAALIFQAMSLPFMVYILEYIVPQLQCGLITRGLDQANVPISCGLRV